MEVMIDGVRYLPERTKAKKKMPFHKLIAAARETKRETLEEAANGIGTTKAHLWALERGDSNPRLPMIQNALRYYGLSFDEIADA